MSKFFILNGPPGIGKDTIAKYVTDHDSSFKQLEFKAGLYTATADRYMVDRDWFKEVAVDRVWKETKFVSLGNVTPREAMIDTSENYIKPKYGKTYFGNALIRASEQYPVDNFVVSDGGFVEEVLALVEGGHEVHIIQLIHKDFNFNGDSRGYVVVPGAYLHHIEIEMGNPEAGYLAFLEILTVERI